jgi:shikimate kinase
VTLAARGARAGRPSLDTSGTFPRRPTAPAAVRRVILIGFMGSGKSAVARGLAERLGWRLVDFDREIERRLGEPLHRTVARRGEGYLRRLESELTAELATLDRVVISPGGGWITQPHLLDDLRDESLVVWLQAAPEEVLRRLHRRVGGHPFSSSPDPAAAILRLMRWREPLYRLADLAVETGGRSPRSVVRQIERTLGRGLRPTLPPASSATGRPSR